MKILVIEDEPKLNNVITQSLVRRSYAVDQALDGEQGEKLAKINQYDLILLDRMLPKRDGMEVCKNLREAGIKTPILMLTAKDTVNDKIDGLDIGADDYLVKPFAFDELFARIRALLRRPTETLDNSLELDGLVVDTKAQRVFLNKKEISLTLREYSLLEYFMRNIGAVVTRQDILEHVWNQFQDPFSNVVDVHLKNLRKKLPKNYANRIKTVWGRGYRLI